MTEAEMLQQLPDRLLPWYRANRRELPWRGTREPYSIWISEIMLQQTRVEAVKGYYARFLEALPTVEALANCGDDRLRKLWEGLGYYSRVRNLKKAAQVIVSKYGGVFPREYADVLSLPGIGPYTAGAICSIAYDMPYPAVDGNVLRVLSRLLDDSSPIDLPENKKRYHDILKDCYPPCAGEFTQALMELGATVCGPNRKPDCQGCPCREMCLGFQRGTAETLPVKCPKRPRRTECLTVFLFSYDGKIAVQKRPEQGLLAGLWQFPNLPGTLELEGALRAASRWGLKPRGIYRQTERTHIFTHICWKMRGYYLEVSSPAEGFIWLTPEEIRRNAALPTAFRQFFEGIDHV